MSKNHGTHHAVLQNLSELFYLIDAVDNRLIGSDGLEMFLQSKESETRLSPKQHEVLAKKVKIMKNDDFMDLEQFETLLTSPSIYKTFWKKFLIIVGDLMTPTSRKLEVRSYNDVYTCCPPALFLVFISLFQTIVFSAFRDDSTDQVSSIVFYGPMRYQFYRYVSYIFVHHDVAHLTGNIVIQLICVPCEIVDHWRVWIIYIASAIFGSASYYVIFPKGELIGASAAVFALLAINIAELIMNWSEMPLRHFKLVLYGSYIFIHFANVAYDVYYEGLSKLGAEVAHLAGLISGMLLGLIMVKNLKIEHYEVVIRSICILIFALLVGILLGLNMYNLYEI